VQKDKGTEHLIRGTAQYRESSALSWEGEKAEAGNKPGSVNGSHSSGIAVTGYL
jgi:hypothetical protein